MTTNELELGPSLLSVGPFIKEYYEFVRDKDIEHLWTLTSHGQTLKSVGSRESVSQDSSLKDGELVQFEIHNHYHAPNSIPSDGSNFIHLSDIAASFNGGFRVFGTYAVLVQNEHRDYIVAVRFKNAHITEMLNGDVSCRDKLYEKIESIHNSKSLSEKHSQELSRSKNIDQLQSIFETLLPTVEFERAWPDELS